jgi:hypothetical protein
VGAAADVRAGVVVVSSGTVAGTAAGRATPKLKEPPVASRTSTPPVRTVTRSPGRNDVAGWNTEPRPAASADTRPACTPLTEPVTTSRRSAAGETPRNVIPVCGEATRSPGDGKACTVVDGCGGVAAAGAVAPATTTAVIDTVIAEPARIATADRPKRSALIERPSPRCDGVAAVC